MGRQAHKLRYVVGVVAGIVLVGGISAGAYHLFMVKSNGDSAGQKQPADQSVKPTDDSAQTAADAEKMAGLAEDYEFGRNRMPDASKAFLYYRQAADKGSLAAEFGLANSYYFGHGTARDKTAAGRWFRKAAEAGYGPAMYSLAQCLAAGEGMTRNDVESDLWITKAGPALKRIADAGDPHGMVFLGIMTSNGDGTVSKDKTEAAKLYQSAADLGDRSGMYYLASAYLNGDGVAKDGLRAVELYRQAAAMNSSAAMVRLGDLYRYGLDVQQSDTEAVRWYRAAVRLNDPSAMDNLAMMFFTGKGVPSDNAQGVQFLRSAAKNDDSIAQKALDLYGPDDGNPGRDVSAVLRYLQDTDAQANDDLVRAITAAAAVATEDQQAAQLQAARDASAEQDVQEKRMVQIRSLLLAYAQAGYDADLHKQNAAQTRDTIADLDETEAATAQQTVDTETTAEQEALQKRDEAAVVLGLGDVTDEEYSQVRRQLREDRTTPVYLRPYLSQ